MKSQRILIIGASSAIAGEITRIYGRQGHQLFLLARDEDKITPLQEQLGANIVGVAAADFTDTQKAPRLIKHAIQTLGGLDITVICHGYLGDQLVSEHDFDEAKRIIEINLTSVVAQLVALLPHYQATKSGNICVLSTVAADRGRPRNFTYGAAKSALNTYLQGLRSVLWPDVGVHTIKLGPVDSPMTVDHEKNFSFSQPKAVAKTIVRCIERGKAESYVPGYWRWVMFGVRNLPQWIFQKLDFLSQR